MTKYQFLTKEILQQDYDELGSLSAIGRKYNMPTGSVKSCAHRLKIIVDQPGGKCKYKVNENIFSDDSESGFYIAGFAAADGNITYDNRSNTSVFIIGLARKDKEHLIKIKDAMNFNGLIHDYEYYNTDYHQICYSSRMNIYCSKKIVRDIGSKFNVLPRKTFTYEFPEKLVDHNLIRHFIRGYFDGDGSFYLNYPDNLSSICFDLLGTQSFLETVRSILISQCNLDTDAIVHPCKNIFRLRFSWYNHVSKIANYLYGDSTIYLQRKYDLINRFLP